MVKNGTQCYLDCHPTGKSHRPIVLAIPRGGAEIAYYIAKHLDAEMALVVTRKLGYPQNPEAAFGAIAEDGSVFLSDRAKSELSPNQIKKVVDEQKKEILRRIELFRKGKPLPDLKGRTVILADDGIATGATLFATIDLCRNRSAGLIVVAEPISGERMAKNLCKKVDDVVILSTPFFFRAVSQGYRKFSNLTDEEVLYFVNKYEQEQEQKERPSE